MVTQSRTSRWNDQIKLSTFSDVSEPYPPLPYPERDPNTTANATRTRSVPGQVDEWERFYREKYPVVAALDPDSEDQRAARQQRYADAKAGAEKANGEAAIAAAERYPWGWAVDGGLDVDVDTSQSMRMGLGFGYQMGRGDVAASGCVATGGRKLVHELEHANLRIRMPTRRRHP